MLSPSELGRMKRRELEELIEMNGEAPTEENVRVYIVSIRNGLNWVRGAVKRWMNATAPG